MGNFQPPEVRPIPGLTEPASTFVIERHGWHGKTNTAPITLFPKTNTVPIINEAKPS
jgi:hypothetical protein